MANLNLNYRFGLGPLTSSKRNELGCIGYRLGKWVKYIEQRLNPFILEATKPIIERVNPESQTLNY